MRPVPRIAARRALTATPSQLHTHDVGQRPDLDHQLGKLAGEDRLGTVDKSRLGSRVDIHHEPVGTGGNRDPAQRGYQFTPPAGVGRVDDDRGGGSNP